MTVVVYTDASFCHKSDIAACGYILIINRKVVKKHVTTIQGLKTPSRSEEYAIQIALQEAFMQRNVKNIILNTDNLYTQINIAARKHKKLMPEMVETLLMLDEEKIHFNILHVKAHRKNLFNNEVDAMCHQQLKKYVSKYQR